MKNDATARAQEVINALKAELEALDKQRKDAIVRLQAFEYVLYGEQAPVSRNGARHISAEAREAISEAQKKRWAKVHREKSGRNSHARTNTQNPPWSSGQDAVIVKAIKLKGPIDATEIATKLAGKLKRSPTAVRQRIHRLAKKQILKESLGEGIKFKVEVA